MTERIIYRVCHGMELSPIAYTVRAAKKALKAEFLTDEQRVKILDLIEKIENR